MLWGISVLSRKMANGVASLLELPIVKALPKVATELQRFQQELYEAVWRLRVPASTKISSLTHYYLAQINLVDPQKLSVRSHLDIVELVDFVRDRASFTRVALCDALGQSFPGRFGESLSAAEDAIDLVVRLWLFSDPIVFQDDRCVIEEQFRRQFQQYNGHAEIEEFEASFEATFFEKVAGITVMGTQCLTNHLRYDRKNKILSVFDVTEFLSSDRDEEEKKLFPTGLLEETQKSLVLLFPQEQDRSNFLDSLTISRRRRADIEMALYGQYSNIHDPKIYDYWQDRLLILHRAYLKAQPGKLMQFWRDRRDANQWTALWLAILVIILTLIFGLVQSITGILQVVVTYRQLHSSSP